MRAGTGEQSWQKMIALVDMNCFFAQIEQQDYPYWRNRPVGVTNGKLGSTIITASYEARSYGVKTGMRLKEARQLCPDIIQAPSRPNRYADVSSAIMESLLAISPTVEVYSVDEAFLDLTDCQSIYKGAEHIGRLIKDTISEVSGLTCSVGISGDKTTAKFAAKLNKPDGLTIIEPWNAEARLANEAVTELSGINTGIASFLAQYGIYKCGDMKKVPMSLIAKRFGNPGRRIWLMAQGKDPEPVMTEVKDHKSIGHGKVMPPGTRDKTILLTYFQHMSEKVGIRLRMHQFQSDTFFIGVKTQLGWLSTKIKLQNTTDDGGTIYKVCLDFVDEQYRGQECRQVQVTALSPEQGKQQDLFIDNNAKQRRESLNQAMDDINQRYGEFTVAPMRVIGRSEMPNVIAPAWKPTGHRKTI
ncbi:MULTISPECIES: DNA polymerase IV [Methylophaga]|jgi:DNA polymerase-4|uniref:DNA polymerase Y family protein n=1 Tax=Methylophaga TaxID=40222 RepID=UPI00259D13D4|nr:MULTISPECIES: DNA polymerase IV [Methylophaga]WVI84005.1 DNA polymerase IV [Methylophaga thalassica]|tara:strand:- start:745 stop:1986 length:1242 start_codon:yes stop_codon:yes gene_type:complete